MEDILANLSAIKNMDVIYNISITLYFMSSLLITFAIAVAHSSRSSSFAACSKYSTFSLVVILKIPWNTPLAGHEIVQNHYYYAEIRNQAELPPIFILSMTLTGKLEFPEIQQIPSLFSDYSNSDKASRGNHVVGLFPTHSFWTVQMWSAKHLISTTIKISTKQAIALWYT